MKGVAKYVKCRFIHNVDTQRYNYATKYINNRGVACVVNRENISCMRYLAKECPTHHNVELSEPLLVANSTELCFELQSTTNDHQGHAKGAAMPDFFRNHTKVGSLLWSSEVNTFQPLTLG